MSRLHPAFDALQAKRQTIFGRIGALPENLQRTRPSESAWSPLEILEHLDRQDRFVIGRPAIRKGRASHSPLLKLAELWSRNGWPIPATLPVLEPHGSYSYEELAEKSDETHRLLAQVVASAGPDETVIVHPAFGSLTVDQVCEGLSAHYSYHLKRLELPTRTVSAT